MTSDMNVTILLAIHLATCLLMLLLCYLGRMRNMYRFLIPACFVPVFGPICMVIGVINTHTDRDRVATEAEEAFVLDEVYRSIPQHDADNMDHIAPIEEVMLIDPPEMRRSVMLDVLYAGANDLVEPIQMAGTNEDTEVVHYAVTALVELRKDFDTRIQLLNQRMEESGGDLQTVDEYLQLDEQYLASGLLDPEHQIQMLRHYRSLLDRRDVFKPNRLNVLRRMARTDVDLKDYDDARSVIGRLLAHYPDSDAGYIAMLRLGVAEHDIASVEHALRLIEEKNIYITPENRRFVDTF